ncbi:MAG: quinone-dependent dihydroorotate dehydrogenase [Candidatus Thermoplasmatota archaeon]|nr:quinone-dependent dihydroorotate dehydrogenase [Candidatus Thermoplasmatota archaeon]|tara:strand:- start:819 stop:1943 length:1125 start_codon:yes stop_codon:yes gene_type:complete
MGWFFRLGARPILAVQDSEKAHYRAIRKIKLLGRWKITRVFLSGFFSSPTLNVERFGIKFSNPVGLAAGMDKKAEALTAWPALGFGFAEVGGVTLHEQQGNPKPRMFRNWNSRSLINRMGFNNDGADKTAKRMSKVKEKGNWPNIPIAINLGKSKITENENAAEDYCGSIEKLWEFADFFVVNVSSPNTPNLRDLQTDEHLAGLLERCIQQNKKCAEEHGAKEKPILVKVAPDLEDEQLAIIARTARSSGLSGIVATNTTISRPEINTKSGKKFTKETGGLSGKPLGKRSTEVIRLIYQETEGQLPIIGVGGISNADDAWEKIINGACLVQFYSAFVFEGPTITKSIVKGLKKKLKQHSLDSLDQAVGMAVNVR